MTMRSMLGAGLATFGVLTFLATPVQGGEILIGGANGKTDPPAPTQGATSEEDWNPTVTCSLETGQGINELLYCLQDNIVNPPPQCPPPNPPCTGPGPCRAPRPVLDDPNAPCSNYTFGAREDFTVSLIQPPDGWGVLILKLDYTEINRLTFRENDPGIQTVELRLNETAVGKVARIGLVGETPAGSGMVFVTVNNTTVSVSTSAFPTAAAINAEIIRQLGVPFSVTIAGNYFHVHIRSGMGDGIHVVQFRSTDPGIVSSDLSLLPDNDMLLLADQ